MRRKLIALALGASCLGGTLAATAQPAEACGNKMHRVRVQKDPELFALEKARYDLRHDRYRLAIAAIVGEFGAMDAAATRLKGDGFMGENELNALAYVSAAVIRSGGKWSRSAEPSRVKVAERGAHVEWATQVLAELGNIKAYRQFYAEALALDPATAQQAADILQALADDGALTESYPYEVLARLQRELGDSAAAQAARSDGQEFAKLERNYDPPESTVLVRSRRKGLRARPQDDSRALSLFD